MAEPNLPEILSTLKTLAYKAGEIINSARTALSTEGATASDTKKNTADLVTKYDTAVENMISSALKEKYPDYAFHGEETYTPTSPLTDRPTFIIDPIDGTINFIHNFPYACVSLGFAVNRVPVVGVVYNPSTNKLYSAIKGQGAFVDGVQLPLTSASGPAPPLTGLENALVAIEWGSDRSGSNWETKVKTFTKLGRRKEDGGAMVRSFRSLGSAALNICHVAEGTVDVYWEGGCWEWDVCAAWCILVEAGGVIVDGVRPENGWEGREVAVDGRRYLAVRGAKDRIGQREIVEEFWGFVQGDLQY